jgi:hypothetical protein
MKSLIVTGLMSVCLMGVPVLASAESDTFFALQHLQAHEQGVPTTVEATVVKLSDHELATVEGGQDVCVICANVAVAANVAALNVTTGGGFTQVAATGTQSIQ